jgi:hypothetical protein
LFVFVFALCLFELAIVSALCWGQRKKGAGVFLIPAEKISGALPEIWENTPLPDLLTYQTGRIS